MMGVHKSYTKLLLSILELPPLKFGFNTTFIILVTFFNSQQFCKLFKQPFFECWPSSN